MSYELCAEDGLTRRALALRLDVEQAAKADTLARRHPGADGARRRWTSRCSRAV